MHKKIGDREREGKDERIPHDNTSSRTIRCWENPSHEREREGKGDESYWYDEKIDKETQKPP